MRSQIFTAGASALLICAASVVEATHSHGHLAAVHKRHRLHRDQHRSIPEAGESGIALRSDQKRGAGQCQFPTDVGLVPVKPNLQNAGWAMAPDQSCVPDSYCPYACPPGQVMMQWDPTATSYTYPQSMNGGLYCDESGKISKPFPDKPYCQDANAGIGALNEASGQVAFCQTVLPGDEDMLIPTNVEDWAELAVPGTDYWCGTAAHYYINAPGVSCEDACVWGTSANPIGNWSPYVAGANVDKNGLVFIKLGWNPIYLEKETPFRDVMPNWGVKVECGEGGGCNGLPCGIDPAVNKVNEMVGSSTGGAGGAAFCVVTVPKGGSANFVIFDGSGGSGRVNQGHDNPAPDPTEAPPEPSPSSSADSSSVAESSSTSWSSSSLTDSYESSWTAAAASSSTSAAFPEYSPHEFYENSTASYSVQAASLSSAVSQTSSTSPLLSPASTGDASTTQLSMASLVMSSLIVLTTYALSI